MKSFKERLEMKFLKSVGKLWLFLEFVITLKIWLKYLI
ncbi:hypothetical protein [Escherichia phage vB_EcoP_EP32B]|nr:hypothetical protein [Escherichia phage vB_EcoP_EP32B]